MMSWTTGEVGTANTLTFCKYLEQVNFSQTCKSPPEKKVRIIKIERYKKEKYKKENYKKSENYKNQS